MQVRVPLHHGGPIATPADAEYVLAHTRVGLSLPGVRLFALTIVCASV
jgi:predicted TIM-barrel enzyme